MNELSESVTLKVSKETARRLASLQRILRANSLDETIEFLVRRRKNEVLDAAFGSDPVKFRRPKEADRLEDLS